MISLARVIVEGAEVPSIPHVLQDILSLTRDPDSSILDLEKRVLSEPGLVTHLLKTVNSAYFGLRGKVASIRQAIVLLGSSAIRSIASGLILINAFNHLSHLSRRYVLTIWNQSLANAGLTGVMAGAGSRERRDALFLTGMVHNAGHLVMAQYFRDQYDDLTRSDPFPMVAVETERFQVDHAEVGAALLEEWKFSKDIIDLVRAHHQPELFQGEAAHINILVLCETLARKGAGLKEVLERTEAETDAGILAPLHGLGWKWEDLREKKEAILQSIEAAQTVIRG